MGIARHYQATKDLLYLPGSLGKDDKPKDTNKEYTLT